MRIKEIPTIERPREKLERYGPEKLSNAELLAILLRTGTKNLNVIKLSQKILSKFEEKSLLNITIEELSSINGVGKVKACEIIACLELGKRLLKDKKTTLLLSPKDVWERMADIRGSKKEHFVVFYLDSRNQEIKREIISIGILNQNLIHPREVFEGAIKNNALNIIICHNHPSGVLEPSEEDIEITKKLVQAGDILNIQVLDHIIVTKEYFYSFNSNHLL